MIIRKNPKKKLVNSYRFRIFAGKYRIYETARIHTTF